MDNVWPILLVIGFLSYCSCVIHHDFKAAYVAEAEELEVIDIEYQFGFLFVDVKVNQKSYRFIIDSGSPTILDDEVVRSCALRLGRKESFVDVGGREGEQNIVIIDSLQFGGLKLKDIRAAEAELGIFDCLQIDGILGANAMRFFDWVIDYQGQQVSVYHKEIPKEDLSGFEGPFELQFSEQLSPYLMGGQVSIEHARVDSVLVDLGSGGSLNLQRRYFGTIADSEDLKWYGGESSIAAFGPRLDTVYWAKSTNVQIGDYIVPEAYVMVDRSYWPSIGNRFLASYNVVLSWHRQQMYLLPIDTTVIPGNRIIGLKHRGDKIVVRAHSGPGPLSAMGISYGDEVLEIDGIESNRITKEQLCEIRLLRRNVSLLVKLSDGKVVDVPEVGLR